MNKMKTQKPTTTSEFKVELWTTVSGPGETREVWATIMLNGPDKGWPCAFGPKEKMEQYADQLNASNGVLR